MNKLTKFGRDVKMRLLEKNLSHSELAQEIGTSASFLSQILHGSRPGEKYVHKIAVLLELDETEYAA